MLKRGKYIAEHDNGILDQYRIVMSVRETEKSYVFELLEYVSRYSPAQMDMLLDKNKRVVISKSKGGHAMRIWNDHDFTHFCIKIHGKHRYFACLSNSS